MKRKYLITLSLFTMLIVTSFTTIVEPKHDGVVVLELFTSQGCSSCPSADDLLGKVSDEFENTNVFALSYHVDYWNYIGWKDPFSQKEFTQKQHSYAQKFSDNQIYTPAVVVNGKEHFVGSNRAKMYAKIKSYQQESSTYNISLGAMENTSETIKFNYTIDGNITATNARVVLAIKERTTHVKRGENANRTLKNHNIVVGETYLTTFENKGNYAVNIPKIVNKNDELRLFFILKMIRKILLELLAWIFSIGFACEYFGIASLLVLLLDFRK